MNHVPLFVDELLIPAVWNDNEIQTLRRVAKEIPVNSFFRIADNFYGKTIVHIAQKMAELDVDGFNCHYCQIRKTHQTVAAPMYQNHYHGEFRFCSLQCKMNHIAGLQGTR